MGVAISSILQPERIRITDLAHRVVAIDAYNMLYQFLTTIRMPDGTPLTNKEGRITSHLLGLFGRTANLLEHQIRLVYVFDGEKPALKRREVARRAEAKHTAEKKYAEAEREKDVEGMRKYAGRTARLTPEMVRESQRLLDALGVPWVQAPAEAEAQAAHMVKRGDADLVGSQDTDCLLFGAPKMVKNLSITGKRRRPGTNTYTTVEPEIITLAHELTALHITQEQLVALGMLVGTDFNPGGIKGLGPKKSLALIQKHPDLGELFAAAAWDTHQDVAWQDVFNVLTHMPVTDTYRIERREPDYQALRAMLVEEFGFSTERVETAYQKMHRAQQQRGLGDFF